MESNEDNRYYFLDESTQSVNDIETIDLNSPVCHINIESNLMEDNILEEINSQSEPTSDSEVNRSKKRKRSYTLADKIVALKVLTDNGNNIRKTSRQLVIPRKNLYRWRYQKAELMTSNFIAKRRRIRPVRHGKWPELEAQLKQWVIERRNQGLQVRRLHLKAEAQRIIQELGIESSCSDGWITRFLNRQKLSLRTATSIGQKTPDNASELALNFLSYVGGLRNKYKNDRLIYANMDEVPVWFDSPSKRTYDQSGQKTVFVKTTNHEKTRFTVVLAALSTGEKLKPMIIFKASAKRISREMTNDAVLIGSENGSMNTEIMEKWRSEIWSKRPNHIVCNITNRLSKIRTVLVMDAFNAHKDADLIGRLDRLNNSDVAIIPGGMTKYLQPADVVYNRSFKALMRRHWDEWIANGPFSYTKSGNRRHASFSEVTKWVVQSWQDVPVPMIVESFQKCGILDEDDSIMFHSNLLHLITGSEKENDESQEHTGISDNEGDIDDDI